MSVDDGPDGGWGSGRGSGLALEVVNGSAGRSKLKEKDIFVKKINTYL